MARRVDLDRGACVQKHARQSRLERGLGRRQAEAIGAGRARKGDLQPAGAVFEVGQREFVRCLWVGGVDAGKNRPRPGMGAARLGGGAGRRIERLDGRPVIGLAHQLLEWRALESSGRQFPPAGLLHGGEG